LAILPARAVGENAVLMLEAGAGTDWSTALGAGGIGGGSKRKEDGLLYER
jgi:hypothetical protein